MKISLGTKPPNYEEILQHFKPPPYAVFTYGDTCYCPDGRALAIDVAEHELVHIRQQAEYGSPSAWWARYINDPDFRFRQELEAYRRQYEYASTYIKDRNQLFNYVLCLANDLSGPMYGDVMKRGEALKLIRQ